ncbi:hypothetical protein [Streptomyces lateritius]|uniref:hypothetical protein n=1 Tax=Streptomyces lateritius TaxID=67313 RepID=UPI0016784F72|nr:hypothetical protein [Streptomyces lateritius]GGT96125.1 hypothetical protein GCM10010272_46160 [Streptomyces lateritius]
MSHAPVPAHRAEPPAPVDGSARGSSTAATGAIGRARRGFLVLGLVLAALFGVCAGGAGPVGAEARPPAASTAPDLGGEGQEVTETEAAPPGRARPRYRGVRTRSARPGPAPARPSALAPVSAPRTSDAHRCVVMRC